MSVARSGDIYELPELGLRIELLKSRAETDGELTEFDLIGRARGFVTRPHRHLYSSESYEVLEGSMRLVVDGRERLLGPGESATTPVAAKHAQRIGPDEPARVRFQLRPPGRTEEFLERLAEISRRGGFTRLGYPKPVAAAELVRDFGDELLGTDLPLGAQRAFSRGVLRFSR